MKLPIFVGLLALAACFQCVAAVVDVTPYTKRDGFEGIKLSPKGDYYAATVPQEGKSVLLIVHRGDNKPTGGFGLGKNNYVADFWWVSPKRLVISMARKFGALDRPQLTGNLYGINADGSGSSLLVGPDVDQMSTGSHIQGRTTENVWATLVDDLPNDDHNVLVSVTPFTADAYSRVDRMDVDTGVRHPVLRSPVRNADFVTDSSGVVRFASGYDMHDNNYLYYRSSDKADWKEINNESSSGHNEGPIGFSADNRFAYLYVQQATGPSAIVALDTLDGTRKSIFRDKVSDPASVVTAVDHTPVGVTFEDGNPRSVFFDENGAEARLHHSLEAAFPGNAIAVSSRTSDGKLALVEVKSDRNPGDFYLFDTVIKKADHLVSRRDWFDPEKMAKVRPFNFKARDGMQLFGYLTLPPGTQKNLPLIVMPHGGPFGIADGWEFNTDSQLLAASGYAVLQVNYRGSGGYGRAYEQAGKRQWGATMQDDVTDATHWAIDQGIADAQRICIYGASYGGYAALMGVAKEPALYKCAVGYVGVYDLPRLVSDGKWADSSKAYLHNWIGDPAQVVAVSPINLAKQIKVPVFLAAGGQDERAPIVHSQEMEKALRAAGVPVETLYFRTEGHGFYEQAHQQEFYSKLLAFLDRNIGAAGGSAPAVTTKH